jgi:hypothetical protein
MVKRITRSAYGTQYVKNNWTDEDWNKYQFDLNLKASVCFSATASHRDLTADERKFIGELEDEMQKIRQHYTSEEPKKKERG